VEIDNLNLNEFNGFQNKSLFTTIPWIRFIAKESNATPLIIRITEDDRFVGYFSSLVIRKFGLKIIGSPFSGWSTCYMGIDTDFANEKCDVIKQLVPFLYQNVKCQFIQIIDREISIENAKENGFDSIPIRTLELNISGNKDNLLKQMKPDCRNFIRQFEKRGSRIEIAQPDDIFAKQYYEQLIDVFAKQGKVPTYSVKKVECLMETLGNSENILCLRIISPDEHCIATSIFVAFKKRFYFWGGASFRKDQHYRPNEYMIWTAIQYWKERGCTVFDMVGIRDYKRKFGSGEVEYSLLLFTKFVPLIWGRRILQRFFYERTRVIGWLLRKS